VNKKNNCLLLGKIECGEKILSWINDHKAFSF
jgi:hypothetical protein